MRIHDIEGIGASYAAKLAKAGIRSTDALLKKGATRKDRKELEAATGIGQTLLLEWVNLADLYRIKGIGSEYSDLLEEAGVDSVIELAKRLPENLLQKMEAVNKSKNLVNQMPGLTRVKSWVSQAKKLKRMVSY
jgi:predicted flap endonuclease-1-like 5' DNA nuclease